MSAFKVQSASNTSLLATVTATFSTAPQAGNLLVAAVTANVGTGSIAITGWTAAQSVAVGIAGGLVIFYKVSAGNETSVTSTATLAAFMDLHIFEYDGIDNAAPLDVIASTADGGSGVTARSSGTTATLTQANELAFAAVATAGNNGGLVSWSNSYTTEITTTDLMTADLITTVTTATSSTATWTTSQRAAGAIVTFFGETGDGFGPKILLKPITPRLNLGHPLCRSLIMNIPFFEGGGTTPLEIAGKVPMAFGGTPTWKKSLYGNCLNFSGASDKVTFTVNAALASAVMNQMTFSCWVNKSAQSATALRIIDPNGSTSQGFLIQTDNNAFRVIIEYGTTAASALSANSIIPVNVWTQLGFTWDVNTNNPLLYVNGVLIASTNVTHVGTQASWSGISAIIGNNVGNARVFGGIIDNLTIWSRVFNAQEMHEVGTNPWQIYTQPGLLSHGRS